MDSKCPMCELKARFDASVANFEVYQQRVQEMRVAENQLLDVLTTPEKAVVVTTPTNGHAPATKRRRRHRNVMSSRTARGKFKSAQHVIGGMKLCSQCHNVKPADRTNFYYFRKSGSGFMGVCIPCHMKLYGPNGTRSKKNAALIRQHSVDAAN